jgi:putative oxidoreductase
MTPRLFASLRTPAYTIMRFALGMLFWFHGAQKLLGWFGGTRQPIASQMGLAGLIEFFGGLAIAFGVLTSYAALICMVEMAVAYVIAHAPKGILPLHNGGELALVYLFAFLFIVAEGGGPWSVDAYLLGSRRR